MIDYMYKESSTDQVKPSLLVRARISTSLNRKWRGRSIKHAGVIRCLRFIQNNWQAQFKLADLEQVAGLKRRGLHKAFVTHLRCSPGVLLRHVRLEYACDLLAHTSLPVTEVAKRAGYRSANSLCVVFMRDLGVSPTRFRSQHKQERAHGSAQNAVPSQICGLPLPQLEPRTLAM